MQYGFYNKMGKYRFIDGRFPTKLFRKKILVIFLWNNGEKIWTLIQVLIKSNEPTLKYKKNYLKEKHVY